MTEIILTESGKTKLVINRAEFKGKDRIDIRLYFQNEEGKYLPTKKGVNIPYEKKDELIKVLQEL